jgi:hypothetical protein
MQSVSVVLTSHHHVLAYLTQDLRSWAWLAILIALFAPLIGDVGAKRVHVGANVGAKRG